MPDVSRSAEPFLDADDEPHAVAFVSHLPLGQLESSGLSVSPSGYRHDLTRKPEQDHAILRRTTQVVRFPIDLASVVEVA